MREDLLEKVYLSDRNLIINGKISTGKSLNVVFPILNKIIKKKESFLVVDSKEEYINKYYDSLKDKGYNNIVINLRDINNSDGFNMLEYPYQLYLNNEQDKALEYITRIYRELFFETDPIDDFWEISATNLLKGLTLALFKDGTAKEINLNSLNDMINSFYVRFGAPKNNYLKEYIKNKVEENILYTLASPIVQAPLETSGGIIGTANQKLVDLVSNKSLSQMLNKTTFDYKDILDRPTAIFVVTRDEDIKLNSIASIFINQIYFILFENKIKNKFNFILDNFDTIDNLVNFREMLSSSIARNMKFTIVTRSIEELEEKYQKYIINNLANTISVSSEKINVNIENNIESINNIYSGIKIPKANYRHKKNIEKNIEVFDIKRYVKDKAQAKMHNLMEQEYFVEKKLGPFGMNFEKTSKTNENDNSLEKINNKIKELTDNETIENKFSVDDIIEKINKKIEELENESKQKNRLEDNQNLQIEILIKKIDKKIEEIEEEEKQKKSNRPEKFNPFSDIEMAKVAAKNKKNSQKEKIKSNDFNIDEIMKKIDKRLAEIEKEENNIDETTNEKKYRKRKLKNNISVAENNIFSDETEDRQIEIKRNDTNNNKEKKKNSIFDFFGF
jgi:hypothetical protein